MKRNRKGLSGLVLAATLVVFLLAAPYAQEEFGEEGFAQEALEEPLDGFVSAQESPFGEEDSLGEEATDIFSEEEAFQEATLSVGEETEFSALLGEETLEDFTAEEVAVGAQGSGLCGENVQWVYEDSVMMISGTGPMEDYDSIRERPGWFDFADELATVIVGEGVTKIGDYAFAECPNLKYVVLGQDLEAIGDWAFRACTSLTKVTIPEKVVTVGYQAFFNCTSLEKAEFGRRVISIYEYCFLNCSSLKTVYLPKELSNVEFAAFDGCGNLTDVYYEGSTSDWSGVTVKGDNQALLNANMHFDYTYVTPTPVPSLRLNKTKKTLYAGSSEKKVKLKATLYNLTNGVQYTSSDPSVATVSKKGVVKAVKKGKAEITATVNQYGKSFSASCTITVKNSKVSVASTLTVKKGETARLQVTTKPAGEITYTSSNVKVATVTDKGVVSGVSKGKATIKVKCNGVTKKVKVTVE